MHHGLDPFAYLRDVFTRIAATPISELDQFLPNRWKAARAVVHPTGAMPDAAVATPPQAATPAATPTPN